MTDAPRKPSFAKSPPELVARFDEVMGRFPAAERRKMFGYPAAFANGNLTTGLHQTRWFVRLDDGAAAELLAVDGAGPFDPMPGRPMRGYVVLPSAVVADDDVLDAWLGRSFAYAATLPPKR